MSGPVIYHGTPMTPRAALLDVCAGRAMCISFFRPDDVEAAEAISPAIMFRQRSLFILESRNAEWPGVGRDAARLESLFRVARTTALPSWAMGCNSRYSRRTQSAQRCAVERLAVWAEGCASLAYGWADREAASPVRPIRPGLLGLDWSGKNSRHARISSEDGGCGSGTRQSLADHSHDAWNSGRIRLSVHQRRQHITGTEWMAI